METFTLTVIPLDVSNVQSFAQWYLGIALKRDLVLKGFFRFACTRS